MCLCCAGFKKKKELQKCFGIFGVIRLTCQELITITQHEPDSTQQYSNNALLKKKYSCLHVLKRKNTHACMYSREKKKHLWLHLLKKYYSKPQNTQYPLTDSTYTSILPNFEYSCVLSSANHFEVKRSE